MAKGDNLGEFEQMVMLALIHLEGGAYGVTIRREIQSRTDRQVAIGAVYATLERLTQQAGGLHPGNQPRQAFLRQPQTTGQRLDGGVAAAVLAGEQMFECVLE